ncbi:MAG: hypothetical protein LBG15_06525 [Dysgonamonadaceae bacterium]|jgi:hypothetical protein|nr:hypothetical protein [Dysgonamonadaceae bacterium]
MKQKMIFLALTLLIWSAANVNAQIVISDNETPLEVYDGAILALVSESKGLLLPQVELPGLKTWGLAEESEPADGMLVYNTGTQLEKGIYLWYGKVWNLVVKVKQQMPV